MSADNTILIAKLPNGMYRVAHIQNYEDYFESEYNTQEDVDHTRTYSFADKQDFISEDEATKHAEGIESDIEERGSYVEYGINYADFDRPLLNKTRKEVLEYWKDKHKEK